MHNSHYSSRKLQMQVIKYLEFLFEILYSSPFKERREEETLGSNTSDVSKEFKDQRDWDSMKSSRKIECSGIVWAITALLIQ